MHCTPFSIISVQEVLAGADMAVLSAKHRRQRPPKEQPGHTGGARAQERTEGSLNSEGIVGVRKMGPPLTL